MEVENVKYYELDKFLLSCLLHSMSVAFAALHDGLPLQISPP